MRSGFLLELNEADHVLSADDGCTTRAPSAATIATRDATDLLNFVAIRPEPTSSLSRLVSPSRIDKGLSYVVTARVDRAQLLPIAETIYKQLEAANDRENTVCSTCSKRSSEDGRIPPRRTGSVRLRRSF